MNHDDEASATCARITAAFANDIDASLKKFKGRLLSELVCFCFTVTRNPHPLVVGREISIKRMYRGDLESCTVTDSAHASCDHRYV